MDGGDVVCAPVAQAMSGMEEVEICGAVVDGDEKVGVDGGQLAYEAGAHLDDRPGAFCGFIYAYSAEAYAILPYLGTCGAKVVGADSGEAPVGAEFVDGLDELTGMHIAAEFAGHEEDVF